MGNIRGNMNLDIARPDADELCMIGKMWNPGRRHFITCIGALPRKLCALETIGSCLAPRAGQVAIAIIQQSSGNVGSSVDKQREHEDLSIPEGMPAIAKARESLGADVHAVIVTRRG